MAKYDLIEMTNLNGSEETVLYPKLRYIRVIGDREFVERMAKEPGGTTESMSENVLSAATSLLARLLSEGYSVKLKGLGTFKATLGMEKGKERETEEDKRNSRSIKVDNITFKPEKSLVRMTDKSCHLERGKVRRIKKISSTQEERLAIALDYLETHQTMNVDDYARITGLCRTSASTELRKLRTTEGSGISAQGRRPHLFYVKSKD